MLPKLLILFIGIPLIELAILVKLGEVFGFWPTIGLVIVTGVLGATLAKMQGFMVFRRIQNELAEGRIPAEDLLDGLMILIGGIVLLTPGLLTDIFGFLLLIPLVRRFVKAWLRTKFSNIVRKGEGNIFVHEIKPSKNDSD